jgi:hypothetical protein
MLRRPLGEQIRSIIFPHKPIDEVFSFERAVAGEKVAQLGDRWNTTLEVQKDATQEGCIIDGLDRLNSRRFVFLSKSRVDPLRQLHARELATWLGCRGLIERPQHQNGHDENPCATRHGSDSSCGK